MARFWPQPPYRYTIFGNKEYTEIGNKECRVSFRFRGVRIGKDHFRRSKMAGNYECILNQVDDVPPSAQVEPGGLSNCEDLPNGIAELAYRKELSVNE